MYRMYTKCRTIGKNSGVNINIAGVLINVPEINNITFIINKIIYLFCVIANKLCDIAWGIWVNAITQAKIFETPIKNITIALILALYNNFPCFLN